MPKMTLGQGAAKLAFIWLRPHLQGLSRRFPGAYRLLATAGRAFFPWYGRIWVRVEAGIARGLSFKLNPRFEIGGFLTDLPPALEQVWREFLVPGAVFYDVGSHIGVFAVSAARMVGSAGAVYAFEADPENCQLIAEHATRNSLRVEVISKAVWKRRGRMRFVLSSPADPSRMSGFIALEAIKEAFIEIETVTLDEFASSHRPPTFIKIDVEGGEAEVLEGAAATIRTFRPALFVEVHNDAARRRVANFLREHKFSFARILPNIPLYLARPPVAVAPEQNKARVGLK